MSFFSWLKQKLFGAKSNFPTSNQPEIPKEGIIPKKKVSGYDDQNTLTNEQNAPQGFITERGREIQEEKNKNPEKYGGKNRWN